MRLQVAAICQTVVGSFRLVLVECKTELVQGSSQIMPRALYRQHLVGYQRRREVYYVYLLFALNGDGL